MKEFIVNENDSGQRIDKFISKLMPQLPKSMMYKGMRKNCVKLNGKHIKDGSVFVHEGDEIILYFRDKFFNIENEFKYVKPQLDIVYEDENILVVNKAVGIAVHAGDNVGKTTLIDMVQSYLYENGEYNPNGENTFKPSLCNRLDRNTGGLIIAAKNAAALRSMNEAIREGRVHKYYLAVAEGYPQMQGRMQGYTVRHDKVTFVTEKKTAESKSAMLDYRVLMQKDGYSLVEIRLYSGRTHQIRAQFAAAGYPLAGDTKYGGHGGQFRQALWSIRLEFDFAEECVLEYLNNTVLKVNAPFEKYFEK